MVFAQSRWGWMGCRKIRRELARRARLGERAGGTVSNLPLCHSKRAAIAEERLINIYAEPFYHVNANVFAQRHRGGATAGSGAA